MAFYLEKSICFFFVMIQCKTFCLNYLCVKYFILFIGSKRKFDYVYFSHSKMTADCAKVSMGRLSGKRFSTSSACSIVLQFSKIF